MSYLHEPISSVAHYRSTDPIKNFKIKVKLERITSSLNFNTATNSKDDKENKENEKTSAVSCLSKQNNVEEFTFKWQQKVFSEEEYQFYSLSSNCDTVLEQKYHKECLQLKEEKGRITNRLFTYVSNDSYVNDDSIVKFTTEPREQESLLAERMRGLRHRRVAPISKSQNPLAENKAKLLNSNIVNYATDEEQRQKGHLMTLNTQCMYVMAELGDQTDPSQRDHVMLCEVAVDDKGIVSLKPDFNDGKKAYPVKLKSCRDLYQYTLEHGSDKITKEELDVERKMYTELYQRHATYLSECVGREFVMPPANVMYYTVFGEIHSAVNFEYDDLYVTYHIDLPDGWFARNLDHLQGVTQACTSKSINRDNVNYFCFPFEAEFEYDERFLHNNPEEGFAVKYPDFFVEVKSLDSWGRNRMEGYGYQTLPDKAGRSVVEYNCWRPTVIGSSSQLRRFFIGGNPVLEDPITCSKPHYFKEKYLSKMGMMTESTGTVKVNFNIIKQSRKFICTGRERIANTMVTYDKLSEVNQDLDHTMTAFQTAKQRMVCARQNLHTEYLNTIDLLDMGKTE